MMEALIPWEGSRPRDPLLPKPSTRLVSDENTSLDSGKSSRRAGTRALPSFQREKAAASIQLFYRAAIS